MPKKFMGNLNGIRKAIEEKKCLKQKDQVINFEVKVVCVNGDMFKKCTCTKIKGCKECKGCAGFKQESVKEDTVEEIKRCFKIEIWQ